MEDHEGLGARLRALRQQTWDDVAVGQRHLAQALGISSPLISSWENGRDIPPEDRLNAYARFFATRRTMEQSPPALVPAEDLTPAEERRRQDLMDELSQLREEALTVEEPRPRERGALGGRFWYFPDGQPITIVCSPLSVAQLGYSAEAAETGSLPPAVQYSTNPTHPNYVQNLGNGDVDSLLELVGHIRAENPTAQVTWVTADRLTGDDLTRGHLVLLGNADWDRTPIADQGSDVFNGFRKLLRIPVEADWSQAGDPEFDGYFKVRVKEGVPDPDGESVEGYRPRFSREEDEPQRPRRLIRGAPQLEGDLALIVRKPNPLNSAAKVTIFTGMFRRGTDGAVRAFTHAEFRSRNENWLTNSLNPEDFWMLIQVTVFGGLRTITPDLSRASTRVKTSG